MKLYNTLTGKFDEIRPRGKNKKLKLFVCGPTVYDHSHIGHARTYVFFDTLVRYLRYKGLKPFFLMNITDIDDKIIARARQTGMTTKEIATIHEKSFLEDMKALKVNVTKYARATDFIPQIMDQIKILLEKGYAYETPSGIYFDVTKFKDYGKLSKQPLSELKVHRIEPDPTKRNIADFSLWKKAKPYEPFWQSPFGKGRPGWHIEDTAIAMHFFGEQYDLHGGGSDLIFPHHEAEIAQAEAMTGKKPYVKHWIHVAHLIVEGRKMSKSLGNYITIKQALKEFEPELLRLLLLQTHYRKELNYNEQTISTAKNYFKRLKVLQQRLKEVTKKKHNKKLLRILERKKKNILNALDKGFDVPKAFTILFTLIKKINVMLDKKELGVKNAKEVKEFLKDLNKIFEIVPREKKVKITKEIRKLIKEREKARKEKNFEKADKIREELKNKGICIEDTPKGPKISFI